MKIGGIDPSSSCSGVAIAVDERLVETACWIRPKGGSDAQRLLSYFIWLNAWLVYAQLDMVCIEFLSVERNAQTTRVVSHYQAASVIACKMRGLVVIEARVSQARKAVLGDGSLSKDGAWAEMVKRHPKHDFGRKSEKNGSLDRMDAAVLALAATTVAEL